MSRSHRPGPLRHGHQTWMEEMGVSDLLRSERTGHEVPGMRGVYGHVSPAMRAGLKAGLQERREASLRERAQLSLRSVVPTLDALPRGQLCLADLLLCGGRYWDRTSDLLGVNEALSR
jgi:hypothetical protein